MRIAILGAGPAGLYSAILLRRRFPAATLTVLEQNPPDATFGFGVVFSDRALAFMAADDPETHALILPHLQIWQDITLDLLGEQVQIDGVGFAAIGRLHLLQILQARAAALQIEPRYNTRVEDLEALIDGHDLILACDGVNSTLRRHLAEEIGASSRLLSNRFAWFGTARPFDTLTQSFRRAAGGAAVNAHHYRYAAEGHSTFIIETDAAGFASLGLAAKSETETAAWGEQVFADVLQGQPLISNRSVWRQFPILRTRTWSARGKVVFLGDALRTAHFSIGSGTRLALEDAVALDRALAAHAPDLPAALAAYQVERQPVVDKLCAAADASAEWYEGFAREMQAPPMRFAWSYITRSGRIDRDRLAQQSPRFVAALEAAAA